MFTCKHMDLTQRDTIVCCTTVSCYLQKLQLDADVDWDQNHIVTDT